MVKLEALTKDLILKGLVPGIQVKLVSVDPVSPDARTVIFRDEQGSLHERMLFRADEADLELVTEGVPWSFTASGHDFKLGIEAQRIKLAHLFDPMMAVHCSNVTPLPHQITAVYEAMLPKQPLRFVLADDPGAGKTIMAGLLIRELMMRGDVVRCMIVSPGSLVDQWQDELEDKFSLSFKILDRQMVEAAYAGNPFDEHHQLICRLDQLSRNEDLQAKLMSTQWDLIIVDEAHKLRASWYGSTCTETGRFKLGKKLGTIARHFLLMTATPHNGKVEEFQTWLSLLDGDRFYGKYRDGVHKVDVTDIMRRLVKEELLTFEGKKLFPPRISKTLNFKLTNAEVTLYEAVTEYVRNEMNKADEIGGKRRNSIGFALAALQRRLASSPEAIYRSLARRHDKLESKLREARLSQRAAEIIGRTECTASLDDFDDDDYSAEELEQQEEELIDSATAAGTVAQLEAELVLLKDLVDQAKAVRLSGTDTKWQRLSELLTDTPEMFRPDAPGRRRKILIFTEHKDTLNYLVDRVGTVLGTPERIATIHGGTKREERKRIQETFRNHDDIEVLIATDAAGEGVNLQTANLMVNYDLPWNPNRIEQRFGRIHRIGQTEVCHGWNMVAAETREGDVFQRLFDKLEAAREDLGGRVYDVLGEVFENKSLKDLLLHAIRSDSSPEIRAQIEADLSHLLDKEHLEELLKQNALTDQVMREEQLFAVKEQMELAEARRLQPFYIRSFFMEAYHRLGGETRQREGERYELPFVPADIRERDRIIGAGIPVTRKYERVCFERTEVRIKGKPEARLINPGHPLMASVLDLTLEQLRPAMRTGAVLVNRADPGTEPHLLLILEHAIQDGTRSDRMVSQRLHFLLIDRHGTVTSAGSAPHLDFEPLGDGEETLVAPSLSEPWLSVNWDARAVQHAAASLVPEHLTEVKERRQRQVDKTLQAVHERLVKEINYWSHRYLELSDEVAAGRQPRIQPDNAKRTAEELKARLDQRTRELNDQRAVHYLPPKVIGGCVVLPQGLINHYRSGAASPPPVSANVFARSAIEQVAIQAVMAHERSLGNIPEDVGSQKIGWDVTSRTPDHRLRLIEVKGRATGADTITVTRNEILTGLNKPEDFILAICLVGENRAVEGLHYVVRPFTKEPDFRATAVTYRIDELLAADGREKGGHR